MGHKSSSSEALRKGRPAKEAAKLTRSVNLKLTETDFTELRKKAVRFGLTATQYARTLVLNGKIKPRFTIEELDLFRKVSGIANNVNQIAKKANGAGFTKVGLEAYGVIFHLKKLLDDSKKH